MRAHVCAEPRRGLDRDGLSRVTRKSQSYERRNERLELSGRASGALQSADYALRSWSLDASWLKRLECALSRIDPVLVATVAEVIEGTGDGGRVAVACDASFAKAGCSIDAKRKILNIFSPRHAGRNFAERNIRLHDWLVSFVELASGRKKEADRENCASGVL